MGSNVTDLATAFPMCEVKVFRPAAEHEAEVYWVTRAGGSRLNLETLAARLRHTPPQREEVVFVQSVMPDAVYRLHGRIAARLVGQYVSLIVEQQGELERIERRSGFRMPVRMEARVTFGADEAAESLNLVTDDVNTRGIRAISPRPLSVGRAVKVALRLRDEQPEVTCSASVVRCRPVGKDQYDLGLCFLNLSAEDADLVVDALMRRMLES